MSPVDPAQAPRAVLFGVSGETLSAAERDFFRDADPLGFILFARNASDPQQVSALTSALKDCVGRDAPVLIDQEGGRVARLKPPHWPAFPAAATFGDEDAVYENAAAIAAQLNACGIAVNCAPVLDVLFPETHAAIGDRAFSSDPEVVARLGAAVCRAYLDAGIVPVIKHMPGQGRAAMDSHTHLPLVTAGREMLESVDFVPYRHILQQSFARAVWGMVSHIVYTAIDAENPATCSAAVTGGVIRRDIGFDGFLLSDDIVMNALQAVGDMARRAEKTIAAGCDAVLHCNGAMDEMIQVAAAMPPLSAEGVRRFNASLPAGTRIRRVIEG